MQTANIRPNYRIYALIFLIGGIIGISIAVQPLSASAVTILIGASVFLAKIWDRIVWFVVPTFYLGFSVFAWPLEKFIFDLPVTSLLFIPVIIHVIVLLNNERTRESKLNWSLIFFLCCFISYVYLSLFWTGNIDYGYKKTAIFGIQAFLPAMILLTAKKYDYSAKHISIALQFIAIITCLQLILFGIYDIQYPGRMTLPGTNPIWLSRIAALAIAASILNFILFPKIRSYIISGIVVGASAYVIVATGSRGPVMALIVAIICGIVLSSLSKKNFGRFAKNIIISIIVIVALLIPSFIFPDLPTRYVDILKDSSTITFDTNIINRLESFQRAIAVFFEAPVIGSGAGGYSNFDRDYPHNLILEVLAEWGIIGMILFSGVIIFLLKGIALHGKYAMFNVTLFISAFAFALVSGDLSSNYEWLVVGAALRRYGDESGE